MSETKLVPISSVDSMRNVTNCPSQSNAEKPVHAFITAMFSSAHPPTNHSSGPSLNEAAAVLNWDCKVEMSCRGHGVPPSSSVSSSDSSLSTALLSL